MKVTPNPTESSESLHERALALAWSLWAEMGVPSWVRRHQDWAIDPEPLILFTTLIGESDPRLRDECIRWCARNSRYISVARLRNLLKSASPALHERWGPFAATVNAFAGAGWPDATELLPVRPSTKDGLDDFTRPAIISLRLRTAFGVSARSEILLYFIAHPEERATAADLSEIVHYSKRNVEKELEALRKAGMLGVKRRRNRLEHYVVQPQNLFLFAAPRPDVFPRWDAIFAVLGALLDYEGRVGSMDAAVAAIEARRLLQDQAEHMQASNLRPPGEAIGRAISTALLRWGGRITEALERGDATSLGWVVVEPIDARGWRAAPAEGVHSVVSPLLATATDLTVWADTRAAQERMSEVLRKLILATTDGLRRIDMAAGEGVQHGGYDGVVVNAVSTPYVPEGQSVWEIGVGGDIKRKADADYKKRSAAPIGANPAETTFIFVTPRRWASKRIWEKECKRGGPWRDVRVIDADDLETWLNLAPAVHAWLSAVLGKSWPSVQDLRSYWADWRGATRPAMSDELVLAGRETVVDDLRGRIEAASALVRVQGESADEALACIAATIDGMDQADALLARALVVNDTVGWDWAVTSTSSLILIPHFADPDAARAIQHGNRVLIPVGREEGLRDDLVLPPLRRDAVRVALQRIGIAEEDADSLATRGRVSLTSLRRSLAINKGKPAWAHRVEAPALLPALLAGAWDERKSGDQEVIAELAERPYQDAERALVHWAQASDPPVRKVGPMWFLVSKEDAWDQLSTYLTPTDLARFRDALLRALGIADPALDLPPEERWMANVRGREHPMSAHLREGLVDTLAIMGARSGETQFLTGHTGQWHADAITRDLLDRANADEGATLWSSLSGVLPLLAEAAPDPFLHAVDVALSRDPSPLMALFADAGPRAALFSASPHTGLLWALENLSWSPDYLGLVSQHLATLSRLDPGGTLGNRPFESLRSIFLIWNPQTAASLSHRLAALDNLRQNVPDIGWRLMLAILPKQHDVSTPSHAPRWRDWKDVRDERVPFEEYGQAIDVLVARLLDDVGANGERWSTLIRILGDLPQDRIITALENTPAGAFSDEDRTLVWEALRSVISKHRSFADADWALPADAVDGIERVYEGLRPRDPVRRAAWLFARTPELVEGRRREWSVYLQAVQDAQADAIRALRKDGSLAELRRLGHLVERPDIVGAVIALTMTAASEDEQATLLALLDASDTPDRTLALGYAAKRFDLGGWPWARATLKTAAPEWAPEKRAAFLRALPFVPETWDWAERFGEDTDRTYWSHVTPPPLDDPATVERAARLLMRYERPAYAVDLLGLSLHGTAPGVAPDLVAEALEQLLRVGDLHQAGEIMHDIATLLDYLATSETTNMSRLAQLEWMFLPLLQSVGRPVSVLGKELARNPEFFIDILCLVFRARDEEPGEATDEQKARAMLSYQLLDSWRRPPGYRDDGTVDKEALNAWVDAARTLAALHKREEIADQQIGRVLRYVPADLDGRWPHRMVRRLVEQIASRDLETGLELGLRNSRGVTGRGLSDGGAQERVLQAQYLDDAQHLNADWPRTAAMVRRIARSYAEEARWQDERTEITEAGWH